MNETDVLIYLTNLQSPFLNAIASVLTFLGNEEFYFLILPFIYWCISKKIGFRLFYVFLLSIYVNSFLKISFAVQRPIGTEGVNSLFVSSAEVGSHYPYDSFPSGHAQGSATLFGYLATVVRRPAFVVFALILIVLISVSRLYTGLHWPTDIIVGASLGLLIVILSIVLQERITRLPSSLHWALVISIPLVMLLLLREPEGAKFAGFLLGAGVGYLTEAKVVRMVIASAWWRKGIAFVIGFIGIVAFQVGLKEVFPETFFFDFIRYSMIGLWGLLGAPWLFVKLQIYSTEKEAKDIPTSTAL